MPGKQTEFHKFAHHKTSFTLRKDSFLEKIVARVNRLKVTSCFFSKGKFLRKDSFLEEFSFPERQTKSREFTSEGKFPSEKRLVEVRESSQKVASFLSKDESSQKILFGSV